MYLFEYPHVFPSIRLYLNQLRPHVTAAARMQAGINCVMFSIKLVMSSIFTLTLALSYLCVKFLRNLRFD
jgi:hypothetical protein